jgi:hypothetical protein
MFEPKTNILHPDADLDPGYPMIDEETGIEVPDTAPKTLWEELAIVLPYLPEKDKAFAASLVSYGTKHHKLTEKQAYYARGLIRVVCDPQATPSTTPPTENLGSMAKVIEMFEIAKSKGLKYPKLHLKLEGGQKVVLALTGPKSKAPGCVNVTDGGKYGNNVWYGRITPDGVLQAPHNKPQHFDLVKSMLRAFAKDPQGYADMHGKLHGHCMFCGKELTAEESTEVGYGPVCASNWGLPWGKAKAKHEKYTPEMEAHDEMKAAGIY